MCYALTLTHSSGVKAAKFAWHRHVVLLVVPECHCPDRQHVAHVGLLRGGEGQRVCQAVDTLPHPLVWPLLTARISLGRFLALEMSLLLAYAISTAAPQGAL